MAKPRKLIPAKCNFFDFFSTAKIISSENKSLKIFIPDYLVIKEISINLNETPIRLSRVTLRELIFAGINFRFFRGFSANSRKFKPAKYNFCQIYRKIWKTPRKMKEICPKKGETAKINSHEMRFFRIFFRPRKLVPAKISSFKVISK